MALSDRERSLLFNAQCLWEWCLDNRDKVADLGAYMEDWGSCETRERCSELAEVIEEDWLRFRDVFDDCFDWEFVPLWMKHRVDWARMESDARKALQDDARLVNEVHARA